MVAPPSAGKLQRRQLRQDAGVDAHQDENKEVRVFMICPVCSTGIGSGK